MAKKNKNPEVRFKGFTKDWEEKKFSLLFNGISNNSLSRDKLNYNSGNAKNVHYGDILVKYNEILDAQKEVIPFVTENKMVEKLIKSRLVDGDIILSDAAEDEMVGKCIEIINLNNDIVFAGLHTIAVRPKQKFAKRYLGYYLNSDAYHDQLLKLMQGTKVLSISKTSIKKTIVCYPESKTEQKQIGAFFQNLDKLITQHQKKHDKLVILKKAMLEKMFPKNGAKVPEIRFKGFTGDWDVENLGKIAKITTGNSNREDSGLEGEYTFFDRSEEVRRSDIYLFDCEAIIIAGEGSDFIPKYFNGKFDLHQRTYAIMNSEFIDGRFLQYQIYLFRKYFLEQAVGSTVKSLRLPMFLNMPIKFPINIKEQQKIGSYFKNLDNQIALHQTQLEKLNNIKKACLSKMFVAQE